MGIYFHTIPTQRPKNTGTQSCTINTKVLCTTFEQNYFFAKQIMRAKDIADIATSQLVALQLKP